ncbi:MAG: putative caax prenyl protease-related protein [Acidobacteria bacterium]|nr:putative caax prenyl protease-related protein [Acidobacteriota bacterium]
MTTTTDLAPAADTDRKTSAASYWLALPYAAPMAVFLAFTALETELPQAWYPALYVIKICAVTITLALFRHTLSDIRPSWRVVGPSLLVGLAVFVAWIDLDKAVPYPHLGARTAFNPFAAIPDRTTAIAFIVVRLYGLAALVPVMEEVFWRGFLLRYLTDSDFTSVPLGSFSWTAFALVAAAFGVAHPEWLPAVVTACAYGLLFRQTRSLFAALVAHATTNAALGAYILLRHEWLYW